MSYTTQCPSCQTRFKVSDAHLALAEGMVRCGRCSHVFHAPSHFDLSPASPKQPNVATSPKPFEPESFAGEDDDFELELPDFQPEPPPPAKQPQQAAVANEFDLPDFDLMQKAPEQPLSWDDLDVPPEPQPAAETPLPDWQDDFDRPSTPNASENNEDIAAFQRALAEALQQPARSSGGFNLVEDTPASPTIPVTQTAAFSTTEAAPEKRPEPVFYREPELNINHRHEPEPPVENPRSGAMLANIAMALLAGIGIVLLLLQLAFINRTTVSAELPELRPAFLTVCAALNCEVPLPTERQLIRTEWSELSFVPQHDHLIQLDATLKNLAPYPQAFPMMEVSLKDAEDRVLIRKTLKPEQYLSAQALKKGQFDGNSELKIVTRMEVKEVKALGYSLLFYYP